MSDLLSKQQLFVRLLQRLLAYGETKGYQFTLGYGLRDPGPHARYEGDPHPILASCHEFKLAQDLNLFVDGQYITGDHPAWHDLGAYWKSLNPQCRWGGDFTIRDYNHVSITFNGIA